MSYTPRAKPYFLDASILQGDISALPSKLPTLFNNTDFMLSMLFQDLGLVAADLKTLSVSVSGMSSGVTSVVNDTNVTGSIAGSVLTLGWTGTLGVARGGTNLASYAQGDLLYASGTTTLAKLAKDTNATRYLSNTGTTNNPAWAQIALATGVSGTLPVANGGSGAATFTAYSVICAGTTSTGAFQNVSGLGTSGQVLTSAGSGALPAWATLPSGAAAGGSGVPFPSRRVPYWTVMTGNALGNVGWGIGNNGTLTFVKDNSSIWQRMSNSGTVAINGHVWSGSDSIGRADHHIFAEAHVRTGSTITGAAGEAASLKLYFFVADSASVFSSPGNTSDLHTLHYAGIRYKDVGGGGSDPGWVYCYSDGTTQTVGGSAIVSIAASTIYTLGVDVNGTTVTFYVNGVASAPQTVANLTGKDLWLYLYLASGTVTPLDFDFEAVYLERN